MESVPSTFRRMRGFFHEEYERAFRHDHWHVGVVDAPIRAFLEPDASPEVRWLPLPGRGKYLADPFGLPRDEGTDILLEEYDFRSDRGVISWVREEADGSVSPPRPVIELPFHASYPYLLEKSGEVYCIPETGDGREAALYRAVDFPRRWEKAATLLSGLAPLDSTIFEWGGLLWLTCTDLEDGAFSKLRLWYARDLLGPWTPHPANPVKTDPASARPAGTPFVADGELYRPAQDCSTTYGGAVVIHRVTCLTRTEFHEEPVATVRPLQDGGYGHGIHTLSAVGDRTLVDGKWFAFDRRAMARSLLEGLGGRWTRVLLRR